MDTAGLRYDGDTRRFMDATYHRHAEESGHGVSRAVRLARDLLLDLLKAVGAWNNPA